VPPLGPKLAIMTLRYALTAILTLLAFPAWAGERVQTVADELNFDEPFEQAASKSVLGSFLNQALDLIENHIEVNGSMQPNDQTGEKQGRFQLKLYPHGKSQSDDHFSAELRFRSSPNDQHLSFDLKRPKKSTKTPFSSPDNIL
jgi:hypothetical protein